MVRLTLADFSPASVARFGITQADLDKAYERERSYLNEPVKEITEDQWDEMLGCLPPENWHSTAEGINVFALSEYTTGNITQHYVDERRS